MIEVTSPAIDRPKVDRPVHGVIRKSAAHHVHIPTPSFRKCHFRLVAEFVRAVLATQIPPDPAAQNEGLFRPETLGLHPPSRVWIRPVRFHFDRRKSERLRANLKRGIGFEEALELFSHPYYQDDRSDSPEQHRAVGWVGERLYSVIFEVREDEGDLSPDHLVEGNS